MLIGILETGHAPDALRPELGDYSDLFHRLLDGHGFDFRSWDVEAMDLPASVTEADGWLITGSRHGAYEDHPWIPPLEQFIREAAAAGRPMVGICFGHQIIAQAMGGRVEKAAQGWGAGLRHYSYQGQDLALNAWHQDQVTVVPPGAQVVGSAPYCPHAALRYPTMLTVQPHPEFDDRMIAGLLAHRGALLPESVRADVAAGLGTPTDHARIAADLAATLKGARA